MFPESFQLLFVYFTLCPHLQNQHISDPFLGKSILGILGFVVLSSYCLVPEVRKAFDAVFNLGFWIGDGSIFLNSWIFFFSDITFFSEPLLLWLGVNLIQLLILLGYCPLCELGDICRQTLGWSFVQQWKL